MIYLFNDVKELTGTVRNNHILNLLYEREKNGIYSVSAEIPVTYNDQGTIYNYNKKVQKSDFLGHYDREGRFQLHKIAAVDIENGSIFVKGIHIFFDEAKAGAIIQDRRFIDREIIDGARVAFESIGWSVTDFDVSVSKTYNFYNVTPLEARQILVETFGFEFDYWLDFDGKKVTNRHVAVKEKIGEQTNKRYTYGHNVLNIRAEQDYSEIYTAVIGRGKGEEIEETGGYGRRIEYTDVVWTTPSKPLNKPAGTRVLEDPNATQLFGYKENGVVKPRVKVEVFSDIESPTELIQASYEWLMDNNVPKAVFSLKVADGDGLNLGDEVYVIYRDIDLVKSARVEKVIDDLVSGNRDVEFGDTAYFDTDRRLSGMQSELKQYRSDQGGAIYNLKKEFDRRFVEQVEAFRAEFEQAKIDIFAEIEADRENMQNLLDTKSAEWTENFNQSVAESKEYAEQQAQEKASAVQSNLDSFKDSHQQLYDEVTGNILDIDTFLGDKSKTLKQQFDKVRTDFGTFQTDLDGVESDLTATKIDLQKQLDEARKAFDELEIGGRNLLQKSELDDRAKRGGFTEVAPYEYLLSNEGLTNKQPFLFNIEVESGNYVISGKFKAPASDYELKKGMFRTSTTSRGTIEYIYLNEFRVDDKEEYVEFYLYVEVYTKELLGLQVYLHNWTTDPLPWFYFKNLKLEKGTVATDWTPAPEDTEQKITTLNQQIEFIDGQLSAKLEQTDLLPINNKITEYGNSLTANAQSIESLISKTELHDGDITKWSNQTTANAESITSALSRISNTESALTKAQTDITANADGLSAVVNRVNKTETGIESLTTDFNIEAGKVETLINKTDGHASQLTNIVADYEKIEQTVAKNDDWLGTHGSNLLQTVEGFEQKVWLRDVAEINPNLIPFADTSNKDNVNRWETWNGASRWIDNLGWYNVDGFASNTSSVLGIQSSGFEIVEGRTYTLSVKVRTSDLWNTTHFFRNTYLMRNSGNNTFLGNASSDTVIDSTRRLKTWTFTADRTEKVYVMFGTYKVQNGLYTRFSFSEPKLEEGTERTLFMNAFSNIEQKANELSLKVAELSSADGEDFLTQSDITVQADRVRIGSVSIGSTDMASILSVSPSAIDMITDKLNLTGNLNVKGQIESLAVSAVRGDIAYLKTNILTANSITSEHLSVSTAMVHKLFAASARIDELITKSHFVNNVKAMSIEAVEGQFSSLMTKYFSANYIDVDYINGKNAWFESQYTLNANIAKLTAQTAFIRDIQAIEITANQLNIQTLHSKLRSVEGGLTIYGPDGRVLINNSILRASFDVQVYDFYAGSSADFNGSNFHTTSSFWQAIKYFYTDFKGSQLLVSWAIGLTTGNSASEYAEVQVRGFGGNNPIGTRSSRHTVKTGETTFHNQIINLGVPDYSTIQGYLEIRRSPTGVHMDNRITARILRISLIN